MKNPHHERLHKMQREYHRNHQWRLDGNGLFIRHLYADKQPTENDLSWWDDFGFIHGGRRVMVWWEHPRMEYADAIDEKSRNEAGTFPKRSLFDDETANYVKVGNSRKKVVSYNCRKPSKESDEYFERWIEIEKRLQKEGIDFEVKPSYQVEHLSWAIGINLVAPIEVRNAKEVESAVNLVKRIMKRETTLEKEFPCYSYGKADWLKESEAREKLNLLHAHEISESTNGDKK